MRDRSSRSHLDNEPIQESLQGGRNFLTLRLPLNTSEKVESTIRGAIPNGQFKVEREERVGALVGGELAKSSLWALGLGILGILIYVTFRFELSFAVGAIVALLHDVLITVGVFSLLGRELTLPLVGAILTIAGYSINDTIVVYDRIREGLASGQTRLDRADHEREHQPDAEPHHPHQHGDVDPDSVSVLLRRRGAARLLARDHHRRRRRNLFLDLHRLADRALVDARAWRQREQPAPGSDAESRGHDPDDGRLIAETFGPEKKKRDSRRCELLRQRAMRLTLALFFLLIAASYSDTRGDLYACLGGARDGDRDRLQYLHGRAVQRRQPTTTAT